MWEKKIFLRIAKLYNGKIAKLSLAAALHWASRYYIATGKGKARLLLAMKRRLPQVVAKFRKDEAILRCGEKPIYIKKIKSGSPLRKRMRRQLYRKFPAVAFYNQILDALFTFKRYGSSQLGAAIFSFLHQVDFCSIYGRKEVVRFDSSYAFNSASYLKSLRLDVRVLPLCLKIFRKMYFNKRGLLERLQREELNSAIYSLTHVIIAESQYYKKFVSGFGWIIKFFIQNLELLIERVTTDVLAEVALCFKLTKQGKVYCDEYSRLKKILCERIEWQKLGKDLEYFQKKEHTMSIMTLLFAPNKRFYKLPKFKNYAR